MAEDTTPGNSHIIMENTADSVIMGEEGANQLIPGYENVAAFTENGFKVMTDAIKSSNKLPNGKARDYYESFPAFHEVMKTEGNQVLAMLSSLLKHAGSRSSVLRRDDDEKFEMIVEANDTIMERVGSTLDEISGIKRNPEVELVRGAPHAQVSGSWNKQLAQPITTQVLTIIKNTKQPMSKPQLNFSDKVDNSSEPFIPRIKEKFNSLKPLAILVEEEQDGTCHYSHPYEFELDHFKPSPSLLKPVKPSIYKSVEETPLNFITSKIGLNLMVQDLKNYKEIAVDLEHHSYRSFLGITCLMQISTGDTDYVIDTMALRNDLHILNEIFTAPSVVKVFHGADMDVLWLQRDLSLYVVNLFDTHQAAKILNYPKLSLAYLLKKFCDVDAQKHFQLADWRVRPLPDELTRYAREDTHYLLYIYHMLRNELLTRANGKNNLLLAAINASTFICKKKYMKPIFDEEGYLNVYNKSKKLFDNRQQYALKHLYKWRDSTAREQDESWGYVLPNHMLVHIAETLPREMQGVLACCNPVPALVRQNLTYLHQIILKAREQPLVKPVFAEQHNHRSTLETNLNYESLLHCPHDLAHNSEFRDDLPTLLYAPKNDEVTNTSKLRSNKPNIDVFEIQHNIDKDVSNVTLRETRALVRTIRKQYKMLTPYERYKLVKPFTDSLDIPSQQIDEQEKVEPVQATPELTSIKQEEPSQQLSLKEMGRHAKRTSDTIDETPKKAKKAKKKAVNPYYNGKEDIKVEEEKEVKNKNFEAFDYSSVDFNKFQGGSKISGGKNNNKNRNKKKKSKCWKQQGNKSTTFSK